MEIAAYFREFVEIDTEQEQITVQGVLRDKQIRIDEIAFARWKSQPRMLKLSTETTKAGILFGNFSQCDQVRIIRWLRERMPAKIQHGWEDSLDTYLNCPIETLEQYNAAFYHLCKRSLVIGLICGTLFGTVLSIAASTLEVPLFHKVSTGLLWLDWPLYGLLAALGLSAALWCVHWILRP